MNNDYVQRKLAAIFYADVVGYSKLMRDDEIATVQILNEYRETFTSLIHQHRGRIVDKSGDSILAEFSSVVDAIQSAVSIQKELKTRNEPLAENRRMLFRIGINIGDVIQEGDRIYGDGVNLAARLEALAHPGGICISRVAYDQIESKLPLGYEYIGEHNVKNINKPLYAYHVIVDPNENGFQEKEVHSNETDSREHYQYFESENEKPRQSFQKVKQGFRDFVGDNEFSGTSEQRHMQVRKFLKLKHLRFFLGIALFLILINILTSFGDWWFHYPLVSIGLVIYLHGLKAAFYSSGKAKRIREQMIERELSQLDRAGQSSGEGEAIAQKIVKKRIRFHYHLYVYFGVNSFLLLIDLFSSPSSWWVHFPLIIWGFFLFLHWMKMK